MSMLQEDAKKRLPFFQALAEGKTVQWKSLLKGEWLDAEELRELLTDDHEMRIKPEPKLRPYTREEWEKVDKVRAKCGGCAYAVVRVSDTHVMFDGHMLMPFAIAFSEFTHLDGSPCGVEEEC